MNNIIRRDSHGFPFVRLSCEEAEGARVTGEFTTIHCSCKRIEYVGYEHGAIEIIARVRNLESCQLRTCNHDVILKCVTLYEWQLLYTYVYIEHPKLACFRLLLYYNVLL